MNEKFGSFKYHEHSEDEIEREDIYSGELYEEDLKERIKELIEIEESKIGEGRSADVYENPRNKEQCFKSLKVDPEKNIIVEPRPQVVNSVSKEAELLLLAHSISGEVEVPYPILDVEATLVDENEEERPLQILMMERLNAVSLKDIMDGRFEFPMEFIEKEGVQFLYNFFNKIDKFIEEMHNNKLYHRDLHEGNIMINLEDGRPCVIDFGSSKKITFSNESDEEIYGAKHPSFRDKNGREKQIIMPKDELILSDVRKKFITHMKPYLTKVS